MSNSLESIVSDLVGWSSMTFGPGPRTEGVLAHIRKELIEITKDPTDPIEWIDVAILALDGVGAVAI